MHEWASGEARRSAGVACGGESGRRGWRDGLLTARQGFMPVLLGAAAFVIAAAVAYAFVFLVALASLTVEAPSSDLLRLAFALAVTALVVAAALGVLISSAIWLSARMGVSIVATLGVAGLLGGANLYWLFWLTSVINACGFGVPFPFWWFDSCGGR